MVFYHDQLRASMIKISYFSTPNNMDVREKMERLYFDTEKCTKYGIIDNIYLEDK